MNADQESNWVLQASKGDDQAFERLVEAYQRPVYNLCYRMLGNPNEAEDATQETFLRVYSHLDTFDARHKVSSWILSIASHYCVDRLRRRCGPVLSLEEIMSWRWLPDDRPRPEESALDRERDRTIHALLQELSPQYRLAIVLRYWHGLSYEEMAEVMGSTVSAVKSCLHRARRAMATRLAEMEAEPVVEGYTQRRVPGNALPRSI